MFFSFFLRRFSGKSIWIFDLQRRPLYVCAYVFRRAVFFLCGKVKLVLPIFSSFFLLARAPFINPFNYLYYPYIYILNIIFLADIFFTISNKYDSLLYLQLFFFLFIFVPVPSIFISCLVVGEPWGIPDTFGPSVFFFSVVSYFVT